MENLLTEFEQKEESRPWTFKGAILLYTLSLIVTLCFNIYALQQIGINELLFRQKSTLLLFVVDMLQYLILYFFYKRYKLFWALLLNISLLFIALFIRLLIVVIKNKYGIIFPPFTLARTCFYIINFSLICTMLLHNKTTQYLKITKTVKVVSIIIGLSGLSGLLLFL